MSFEANEVSVEGGQPIELYEFSTEGDGYFLYTNQAEDLTIGATTYKALAISRSRLEESNDIAKSSLTLTAPYDFEVAELFAYYPPDYVLNVTLKKLHRGDLADIKTFWIGRVLNASWTGQHSKLSCESIQTSSKRPGLRRPYSFLCPHALYGKACGASQALFESTATITAISGLQISATLFGTQANGWWKGGKLRFLSPSGVTRKRSIRDHSGINVTLTHPILDLAVGNQVVVAPGCDHQAQTCNDKFSNILNHGGENHFVSKNPFGNTSVW